MNGKTFSFDDEIEFSSSGDETEKKTTIDKYPYSKKHRKDLDTYIDVPQIDNSKRLEWYHMMGRQLYQEAVKAGENDMKLNQSYVNYKRFILLALHRVPHHNAYNMKQYAPAKAWFNNTAKSCLDDLEKIVERMENRAMALSIKQLEDAEKRLKNLGEDGFLRVKNNESDEDNSNLGGKRIEVRNSMTTEEAFEFLKFSKEDPGIGLDSHVGYPQVLSPDHKPSSNQHLTSNNSSTNQEYDNLDPVSRAKLRKLSIPMSLIQSFANIASPNTNKPPYGIETCGVLAGIEKGDALCLTHLIIPKQVGSSDTVAMTNEEELFEECIKYDPPLIILGWIHTHPQQSCFLSSVDMHTHCGFQTMLPEAVAIVLAPRDKEQVGVFRLTEPGGLKLIQKCELRGFHQHPTNIQIYEKHKTVDWSKDNFHIKDLREI